MILIFILGISGSIAFDRVLQIEYETDRFAWEADGKPRGIVWCPPEELGLGSMIATTRLQWVLLFKTPAWAAVSPEATKAITRFRFVSILFLLFFIIFIVLMPFLMTLLPVA